MWVINNKIFLISPRWRIKQHKRPEVLSASSLRIWWMLPFHSSIVCSLSSNCLSGIFGGGYKTQGDNN